MICPSAPEPRRATAVPPATTGYWNLQSNAEQRRAPDPPGARRRPGRRARPAPRACRGRRRGHGRTASRAGSSSSSPSAAAAGPIPSSTLRGGRPPWACRRRPLPVVPVVVGQQGQAHRHRLATPSEVADEDQVARATWTSWSRPARPARRGASAGRRACPVTDSHWATSHSWWGKTRSRPPPWRSMVSPSSRRASAEHSMCQPGRPGPQRDSQAGSSGSDGCHSTKSSGSRLLGSSGLPPCSAARRSMRGRIEVAQPAERDRTWRRRSTPPRPTGRRGRSRGRRPISERMSGIAEVARGSDYDRQEAERVHVGVEAGHLLGGQVEVVHTELAGLSQDVVVDVGHVAHAAGLVAEVPEPALQDVEGQVDRGVAEVRGVVGGDPAGVHRDRWARARTPRPPAGPCRTGASPSDASHPRP